MAADMTKMHKITATDGTDIWVLKWSPDSMILMARYVKRLVHDGIVTPELGIVIAKEMLRSLRRE